MFQKIQKFFATPIFEDDEDKTRRARLLHVVLVAQVYVLLILLAATFYSILTDVTKRRPELLVMMGGLFLVMFWRFLMRYGQVNIASTGMIISFLASITIILILGGTIRSAGVIFLPLTVVMATLLIGRRAGVIFFVLTCIVGMGLVQGEINGLLPTPQNLTTYASHAIIISGMGLTLILLYLATQGTEDALQRAVKNEHEVRLLASTLEQRVEERTAAAESARMEAEAERSAAEAARKNLEDQVWLTTGQTKLADAMRGEQPISQLADNVVSQLCQYTGAQAGGLFLLNENTLTLTGRYAFTERHGFDDTLQLGEGFVGQAAVDGKVLYLNDIPSDTLVISTGLVDVKPRQMVAAPFYANGKVVGVLEVATLYVFTQNHFELWNRTSESIGVAFRTAQTRQRLAELLMESQQQTEELQAQEEELRAANEELHAQAENLRAIRDLRG